MEKASERARRIGEAKARFNSIVVDYPPMTAAIEAITVVREMQRAIPSDAASPMVLLNAPLGTGKSMTLKTAAAHAAAEAPEGHRPILVVQTPSAGTTDSIPSAILKALGAARPDVGKVEARWLRAVAEMRRCHVEVAAFDEFNRAARRPTMSRPIAMAIREHLVDEGVAAVAFVGTADAAVVLGQCEDILDRLEDEIDLSPLAWHEQEDRELLFAFLRDVDAELQGNGLLAASSGLGDEFTAKGLCEASKGRLRPLMGIIRGAMALSMRRDGASITADDLRQSIDAYSLRVDFIGRNEFS